MMAIIMIKMMTRILKFGLLTYFIVAAVFPTTHQVAKWVSTISYSTMLKSTTYLPVSFSLLFCFFKCLGRAGRKDDHIVLPSDDPACQQSDRCSE